MVLKTIYFNNATSLGDVIYSGFLLHAITFTSTYQTPVFYLPVGK